MIDTEQKARDVFGVTSVDGIEYATVRKLSTIGGLDKALAPTPPDDVHPWLLVSTSIGGYSVFHTWKRDTRMVKDMDKWMVI